MASGQAYLRACGIVLLAFAAVVGRASAEEGGPAQVLLMPGHSVTFADAERPGVNVVLRAPANAFLDISSLAAAGEKHGIYSVLTAVQVRSAGALVSNADGSIALRPASGPSFYLPLNAAPTGRRVLIEGGVAVQERGRVVLYSDRVVTPAVVPSVPAPPALMRASTGIAPHSVLPAAPAAPASAAVDAGRLPAAGTPVPTLGSVIAPAGMSVSTTGIPAITSGSTFNVGSGSGVVVNQAGGSATLLQAGNGTPPASFGALSANGATVTIAANGIVTVSGGATVVQMPGGGVNISTQPASPPGGTIGTTTLSTTGVKPPTGAGVIVR